MSLSEAPPVRLTPIEKGQDLRWDKDEDRLPDWMVEWTVGGQSIPRKRDWSYGCKGSRLSHRDYIAKEPIEQ